MPLDEMTRRNLELVESLRGSDSGSSRGADLSGTLLGVFDRTLTPMDAPFPVVDALHAVDAIVKLLSKSNPAVLVQDHGRIQGIVTRSDMLSFMMAR